MDKGQRIKLDTTFLNLEYDRHCRRDSVIVKDTAVSRTSTVSYCGNSLPTGYLSSANVLHVVFQSDRRNFGTGFKIRYQAISGTFADAIR